MDLGGNNGANNGGMNGMVNSSQMNSSHMAALLSVQQFQPEGVLDEPVPRDRSNTWHGPMMRKPQRNLNQSTISEVPEVGEASVKYAFPSGAFQNSQTNIAINGGVDNGVSGGGGLSQFTAGGIEVKVEPVGVGTEAGASAKKPSSRKNAWGPHSYADLITSAIQSSADKRLTLSQVYDWMVQNVAYFRDKGDNNSSAGWKNSIRHNLSLHNRFMRVQNEGAGKSSWWVINPEARGNKPRVKSMDPSNADFKTKRDQALKSVRRKTAAKKKASLSGAGAPTIPGPGNSPVSPATNPGDLYSFNPALSPDTLPNFRDRSTSNPITFSQRTMGAGAARTSPSAILDQSQPSPFGGSDSDTTGFLPGGATESQFDQISSKMPYLKLLEPDLPDDFDALTAFDPPPLYPQQEQTTPTSQTSPYDQQPTQQTQSVGGNRSGSTNCLMQRASSHPQGDPSSLYGGQQGGNDTGVSPSGLLTQLSDPLVGYCSTAANVRGNGNGQPFNSYSQSMSSSQPQQMPLLQASTAMREVAKRHQLGLDSVSVTSSISIPLQLGQQQQQANVLQQQQQQQQEPSMDFMNMGFQQQLNPFPQSTSLISELTPSFRRDLSLNDIDLGPDALECDIEEVLRLDSNMDYQASLGSSITTE